MTRWPGFHFLSKPSCQTLEYTFWPRGKHTQADALRRAFGVCRISAKELMSSLVNLVNSLRASHFTQFTPAELLDLGSRPGASSSDEEAVHLGKIWQVETVFSGLFSNFNNDFLNMLESQLSHWSYSYRQPFISFHLTNDKHRFSKFFQGALWGLCCNAMSAAAASFWMVFPQLWLRHVNVCLKHLKPPRMRISTSLMIWSDFEWFYWLCNPVAVKFYDILWHFHTVSHVLPSSNKFLIGFV